MPGIVLLLSLREVSHLVLIEHPLEVSFFSMIQVKKARNLSLVRAQEINIQNLGM